jgi:alpha-tubulin suppressor-like RCC1 family protein
LGNNTTTNSSIPLAVLKGAYNGTTFLGDDPNNPIILISSRGDHNIVLAANGTVYSFGRNDYGQLGENDLVYRSSPTLVGSDSRFLKLYN